MKPALVDSRKARLYTALAARDMTADQLAGLMRVDRGRVHRWHSPRPVAPRPTKGEKRGGPPSAVTTEAIAAALDLPAGALEVGGPWGPLVGEAHGGTVRALRGEGDLPAVEGEVGSVPWRVVPVSSYWVGTAGEVPSFELRNSCRREAVRDAARRAGEIAGIWGARFVKNILPTLDTRCVDGCPICEQDRAGVEHAERLRQVAELDALPDGELVARGLETLARLKGEEEP